MEDLAPKTNSDTVEKKALTSEEVAFAHENPHLIPFCEVPGRLSLLGSNKKVVVTLAEIKRRINPPEALNQSIMSAMLRKAKNRDGGEQLTKRLREFDIVLPQGRRKSLPNTLFTSLCEVEAATLASDFLRLSQHHYPVKSIIYEIFNQVNNVNEIQTCQSVFETTYNVIEDVIHILGADKAPISNMLPNIETNLHPGSQDAFSQFSLLTHGFGTRGHIAALSTFSTIMREGFYAMMNPSEFCNSIHRPLPMSVQSAILEEMVARSKK